MSSAISNGARTGEIWTPRWFVREVEQRNEITFDLDLAAGSADASVCARHVDAIDGAIPAHSTWWLNPPWSDIQKFIEAALNETLRQKSQGVVLLPCRPEAAWWRWLVGHPVCRTVDFVYPRLNYYYPNGWETKTGRHPPAIRSGMATTSALFHVSSKPRMSNQPTHRYVEYRRPKGADR